MKIGPMTYRPTANWTTAILLAVFMLGFGAFAESQVPTHHTHAIASESAATGPVPQAILRLF